jgi:hypothetical protein
MVYGYAMWDGDTDWFRTNPSTRRPLVYWDLKKLKAVREKLIQAGVPPQRVQPVELLGSLQALRRLDLESMVDRCSG